MFGDVWWTLGDVVAILSYFVGQFQHFFRCFCRFCISVLFVFGHRGVLPLFWPAV